MIMEHMEHVESAGCKNTFKVLHAASQVGLPFTVNPHPGQSGL